MLENRNSYALFFLIYYAHIHELSLVLNHYKES
nr:MAG TPA: hypothetical protein [Caudoviricetes sp.]